MPRSWRWPKPAKTMCVSGFRGRCRRGRPWCRCGRCCVAWRTGGCAGWRMCARCFDRFGFWRGVGEWTGIGTWYRRSRSRSRSRCRAAVAGCQAVLHHTQFIAVYLACPRGFGSSLSGFGCRFRRLRGQFGCSDGTKASGTKRQRQRAKRMRHVQTLIPARADPQMVMPQRPLARCRCVALE